MVQIRTSRSCLKLLMFPATEKSTPVLKTCAAILKLISSVFKTDLSTFDLSVLLEAVDVSGGGEVLP